MQSTHALVFAYDVSDDWTDRARQALLQRVAPHRQRCGLRALTHGPLGMRREWRLFTSFLSVACEFGDAPKLRMRFDVEAFTPPAVFWREGRALSPCVDAEAIGRCGSLSELKALVRGVVDARDAAARWRLQDAHAMDA